MTALTRLRVKLGATVFHGGRRLRGGQAFEVRADVAEHLLDEGHAVEAPTRKWWAPWR